MRTVTQPMKPTQPITPTQPRTPTQPVTPPSPRRACIHALGFALVFGGVLAGCALTRKSAPLAIRYFTPELTATTRPMAGDAAPPLPQGAPLRLGRVVAAAYIRDKIVYRDTAHEVAFHEQWRWSEAPAAYVRRALARELFQTRGLRQAVSGPGLTLEVELEAFEEWRKPEHLVRVALTYRLRDDQQVLAHRTVGATRPLADATGEAVAMAMASALDDALAQLVDDVVGELASAAPPEAPLTTDRAAGSAPPR